MAAATWSAWICFECRALKITFDSPWVYRPTAFSSLKGNLSNKWPIALCLVMYLASTICLRTWTDDSIVVCIRQSGPKQSMIESLAGKQCSPWVVYTCRQSYLCIMVRESAMEKQMRRLDEVFDHSERRNEMRLALFYESVAFQDI